MTNTKKPTKRMHYNELLKIEAVKSNPELVEFINKELALLDKKNASNSAKRTPTQIANDNLKDIIVAYLADGKAVTVSDLIKSVPELDGMSTSKVSALVRQLKEANIVERYEDKRKAYFRLANVEVAE